MGAEEDKVRLLLGRLFLGEFLDLGLKKQKAAIKVVNRMYYLTHFGVSQVVPVVKKVKREVKLLSCVQPFVIPWTVAYHTPPSMGFSRQEY